ncbi:Spx/MgsR family transcriptional regulator [Rhizobium sp. SG_E_25_P2]|nr:Spx/MgsR family transcriptional regulator [Rhizobium sp. SG_E_25_P2]
MTFPATNSLFVQSYTGSLKIRFKSVAFVGFRPPRAGCGRAVGWIKPTKRDASHMNATIYGIKNCDTMKKAFAWLDGHGVDYRFHDYKKEPPAPEAIAAWVDALGWETVLNRAGTTFKKLPEEDRTDLDRDKAIRLMAAQPSMIKRPILDRDGSVTAGFKPDLYAGVFGG